MLNRVPMIPVKLACALKMSSTVGTCGWVPIYDVTQAQTLGQNRLTCYAATCITCDLLRAPLCHRWAVNTNTGSQVNSRQIKLLDQLP